MRFRWLLLLLLSGGIVLPSAAAAQPDLKAAKPELDARGRAIPGHFTVTICRGTFYDMTPTNRGRDRYTTPHEARVIRITGNSARAGGQGTNGTLRISSGAPGIPAGTGETTIEYDIIDDGTGRRVQRVVVKVKVIDCTPPTVGDPPPPPPTPPATPPAPPPAPQPPPPPVQPRPQVPLRTPTHRTTKCAACRPLADQLNAASDRLLLDMERGGVPPDIDPLVAEVARLSAELTACEKKCAGTATRTKAFIGGGIAAVAGVVAMTGGSGGGGQAPAASNPPASPPAAATGGTPPPAAPNPAGPSNPAPPSTSPTIDVNGNYPVNSCRATFDPGLHELVLQLCQQLRQIRAAGANGSATFSATSPSWVLISGAFNLITGEFSMTSQANINTFTGVLLTLRGNINAAGSLTWLLEVGGNGALPGGQPARYEITGQRQ